MTVTPIPTAQTLTVHSVESFFTRDECAAVVNAFREVVAAHREGYFSVGRETSVHSVDGLSTKAAMDLYEPAGRLEVTDIPEFVTTLTEKAFERVAGTFSRSLPAARRIDDLIYLEYGADQFITPHIDYSHNDRDEARPKVAGISILLSGDHLGGDFFIETSGSDELWCPSSEHPAVRDGADASGDWFRHLRRTRWRCAPSAGDAVIYGSQLTHGTYPVTAGTARKLIGFLTP